MATTGAVSAEAQVLGHVLDGDDDAAMQLLRTFLPGEVRELFAAAVKVSELCAAARQQHNGAIHWGNGADGDGQTRHDGLPEACADLSCRLHHR